MSDITLEQIKERLVPVLQQIGLVYTLDTRGKERERWDEMHRILSPLFLDISVAIDHQEEAKPVRDTQFLGFAKLLWDELEAAIRYDFNGGIPEGETRRAKYIPSWQEIIARRSYDFACHVGRLIRIEDGLFTTEEIPNMTELPKEQENG